MRGAPAVAYSGGMSDDVHPRDRGHGTGHAHGHGHSHGHSHDHSNTAVPRLAAAFALTAIILVAEVIGIL